MIVHIQGSDSSPHVSTGAPERHVAAVLEGRLRDGQHWLLPYDPLPLDRLQPAREAVDLPVSLSQLDLLSAEVLQTYVVAPPVHWTSVYVCMCVRVCIWEVRSDSAQLA